MLNGDTIDLFLCGSPCKNMSIINSTSRDGVNGEKSKLFFKCIKIMEIVKPKYFLFENVGSMTNKDKNIFSEYIGCKPIQINSSLVSAQIRDRLYWTNIPNVTLPTDMHIELKEILIDGYTHLKKAKCLLACDSHGLFNGCNWNYPARYHRAINKCFGTMIFKSKEHYLDCKKKSEELCNGRSSRAEYFNTYDGSEFDGMRYLWKEERARLQGVPEKYVECMTEKDASDLLGDGWNIKVISHILSFIPKEDLK